MLQETCANMAGKMFEMYILSYSRSSVRTRLISPNSFGVDRALRVRSDRRQVGELGAYITHTVLALSVVRLLSAIPLKSGCENAKDV